MAASLEKMRSAGIQRAKEVRRALRSPTIRRNDRDDRHLAIAMAAILRSDSNCIDIGANVGSMIAEICRLAPAGRHIAIEPLPELASNLERRFPQVDVHCCALSNEEGERTFVHEIDVPALSGFRRQSDGSTAVSELTVSVRRLDDIVPVDLDVAFVKIDVEGAEEEVLRGGLDTIHRCRPVIALEHGASAVANYGTTHGTIHDLLSDAGLAIFDMDGQGPLSRDRFEQVADPPGDRWNFLARPL